MASVGNGGKGKGKAPPPPAKGKGKDRVLSLDSVAPSLSRTAMFCLNGDIVEATAMSGKVLFTFPAAVMVDSTKVHVLKRKIEHLIKGKAFKAQVQLLRDGIPMSDDVVVSDLSDVIVKWSTGWHKVETEDELAAQSQRHFEIEKSIERVVEPVDVQGLSFQDCREQVVHLLEISREKLQRKFEEDILEWEDKVTAWQRNIVEWDEEEERRKKLHSEAEANGKGKGMAKGKGKGKGKMRRRPEPPVKPEPPLEPAKIVTGFQIQKGVPGKSWPIPEADCERRGISANALPIQTDVPNFAEARQLYVDSLISRYCPDYAERRALESVDPECAEFCEKVRETLAIRHIPPARPKEDLHIPESKPVDIFETIRTHLSSGCSSSGRADEEIPLPIFGFCVDVNIPASDLCCLLESIRTGDHEGVAHNASVGLQFRAEAKRLGIHLKDVLHHLEVRVLDKCGSLSYPVYPPLNLDHDYVDPRVLVGNIPVAFIVGSYGLPRSAKSTPSASDLCTVAINPRSYNEHKRLALEALAISTLDSDFSSHAKKGLVTIGCLLSTHSDAAVREQALELLVATANLENLDYVASFFKKHSPLLGERIVQELCSSARLVQQ